MKYYLLQIKEGPHGGPFYDTVNKWISAGYAAVFTKDPLGKIGTNPVSADVEKFIELFNSTQNDDSIILSIGEDETSTDSLYIYQKDGPLEEITSLSVDKKNYKTCNYVDNAIGFKIKLLKKIKVHPHICKLRPWLHIHRILVKIIDLRSPHCKQKRRMGGDDQLTPKESGAFLQELTQLQLLLRRQTVLRLIQEIQSAVLQQVRLMPNIKSYSVSRLGK